MAGSKGALGSIYRVINQQLLNLFRLWLRPTFINHEQAALELPTPVASVNVRYILDSDSLADRLLLELGCEAGSLPEPLTLDPNAPSAYFCLNHREGFWGRRSARADARPTSLQVEPPGTDQPPTRFIPVSIYWGHQPDRALSMWKVLLSDQWASTSKFRKILCIALTRQHILVHFGAPLKVDDLTRDLSSAQLRTKRLHRLLRSHFKNQKQSILGPDLSHRRTLLDELLAAPAVETAIDAVIETSGLPRHRVSTQAYRYASEIASDQSYRIIRFFSIILTWLWNRLYDGIEVSHLERVRAVADSAEIVYVPCHRSHIDYLLLSYVLYHNGLALPHIAAGINLNLFLVGPLLRRAGAFFMHRSFKEDPLYKAVFDEYIHLLLLKGYSLEYFVEGGRSRTGGMLAPRPGMISMTLKGYYRDHRRDIQFIPVYFSYERVLEISSYLDELKGKRKKTESLLDLFGVFRLLKLNFGQVSVNFGHPISLEQFLAGRAGPDFETVAPESHKAICSALGQHIVKGINAAIPVNPTQLLATLFVHADTLEIPERRLVRQLRFLANLIEVDKTSSMFDQSDAQLIDYFLSTSGAERQMLNGEPVIGITHGGLIDMRYYSNSVAHLLVLPSLLANRLSQGPIIDIEQIATQWALLAPFFEAELFCSLVPSPERINQTLTTFELETSSKQSLAEGGDDALTGDLNLLARIVAPNLNRLAFIFAILEIEPDFLGRAEPINDLIRALKTNPQGFSLEDFVFTEPMLAAIRKILPLEQSTALRAETLAACKEALVCLVSAETQQRLNALALNGIEENIQSAATAG